MCLRGDHKAPLRPHSRKLDSSQYMVQSPPCRRATKHDMLLIINVEFFAFERGHPGTQVGRAQPVNNISLRGCVVY
jgi:hypothetical protein